MSWNNFNPAEGGREHIFKTTRGFSLRGDISLRVPVSYSQWQFSAQMDSILVSFRHSGQEKGRDSPFERSVQLKA